MVWIALQAASAQPVTPPASQSVPSDPFSYVRTSEFTYYPDGLLKSETVEPGIPEQCVITTYEYDGGNKTKAKTLPCAGVPANANFAEREIQSAFAARQAGPHFPAGAFATRSEVLVAPASGNPYSGNPDNHVETRDYDPRFGTLVKLVGPNQIETRWEYDDFGRKTAELRADGTKAVFAYCVLSGHTSSNSPICHNGTATIGKVPAPITSPSEVPAGAFRYEHTEERLHNETKIGAFTRIYYDAAGRKLRVVTQGFQSEGFQNVVLQLPRLIFQNFQYNAHGLVVLTTQPYFANTNGSTSNAATTTASVFRPYGVQRSSYDALGRPTQVLVADDAGSQAPQDLGNGYQLRSARTGFTYEGLVTTITDDKGNTRKEENSPEGKVVRTTNALLAQVLHQHDAFGNLIETRDPHENKIVVRYDTRGRKISINDPDAGVTESCYDALGQLKAQQTSKERNSHVLSGCPASGSTGVAATPVAGWTVFAYDLLGRMTERRDPNYITNWYHDKYFSGAACNKGKGKLCEVRTTTGLQKRYVYDNIGRPQSTRVDYSEDRRSMATAVSYDVNGRLATRTFPTGVRIRHHYVPFTGHLARVSLDSTVSNVSGANSGRTLWQALTVNAWGKVEHHSYSTLYAQYDENYSIIGYGGTINETVYDGVTGRVNQLGAGAAAYLLANVVALGQSSASMFHHRYEWNSINLLTTRTESKTLQSQPNIRDSFRYDALGRLNHYSVSGTGGSTQDQAAFPAREVALQYNALGMLLYKSDVGVYSYGGKGVANGKPHAVQSISGQLNATFSSYDLNGNLTSASGRPYTSIAYTSFNLPDQQTGVQGLGGMPRYSWRYGEDRQRVQEERVSAAGTRKTYFMHPDNQGGLGFEYEVAPNGTKTARHYIQAGDGIVLVTTGDLPNLDDAQMAPPNADGAQGATAVASGAGARLDFWHRDHLGSVIAVSDGVSQVSQRFSYDPFGLRRNLTGTYDPMGTLVFDWEFGTPKTDRGFTGHEHLDDVGLIHMNGRVFDPRIGRFLQADPLVSEPLNLQNYDRYQYCYNSPLICTDPTGYFSLKKFLGSFLVDFFVPGGPVIGSIYRARMIARSEVGYQIGAMVINIGCSASGGGAACVALLQTGWSALAGHSAGASIEAGLRAGLSAAVNGAIGGVGDPFANAALHVAWGCAEGEMSGAGCASGARGAVAYSLLKVAGFGGSRDSNLTFGQLAVNTMVESAAGGLVAKAGGGSFAQGARSAAMAYLFNQAMHGGKGGGPRQPGWGYEYPDVDHPFAPNDEFKARFFGSEEERRVWFRTQEIAAGTAETREWLRFDDPKVQLPRSGGRLYQIFDLGLAEAGAVRIAYSPKFPNVFYVSLDHYQPTPAQPLRWTRFEAAPPKN